MTHKMLLIITLIFSVAHGQDIDSTEVKTANKAALWSILPGAGQIYNGKYIKAGIIITLESLAIWQSIENGKKYNSTKSSRYLSNRNEYAWWAFFVHVYGLLDAVVDRHLEPFEPIMEDESIKKEVDL